MIFLTVLIKITRYATWNEKKKIWVIKKTPGKYLFLKTYNSGKAARTMTNRGKSNRNCSTVLQDRREARGGVSRRKEDAKKRWSSLDSRVYSRPTYSAHLCVFISRFSQATVNDHRGGRTHDTVALVIYM